MANKIAVFALIITSLALLSYYNQSTESQSLTADGKVKIDLYS
jgi:hypothetical protein